MPNVVAEKLKLFLPLINSMLAKVGVTKGPEIQDLKTDDARDFALAQVNDAAFRGKSENALVRLETADSVTLLFCVTMPKVTT